MNDVDPPSAQPLVTIAFIPRERFSRAADALRQMIENTADVPYKLLIVDCRTPARYLRDIEGVVKGRADVEWVRSERYLMPSESRRLIAPLVTTEYTCLLENDCFVAPGWLSPLMAAVNTFDAGVAAPLLYEGNRYHADNLLGTFLRREVKGGTRLEIVALGGDHETQQAQVVQSIESHVLLFRTAVLQHPGLFDEKLTTHDFLDICLTLDKLAIKVVFEPKAEVTLVYPPPVEKDEQDFFRLRWSLEVNGQSSELIRKKWGYTEIISATAFARERLHRDSWLNLGIYTLKVRVFRRLRTWFRRYVLRWGQRRLLDYDRTRG